MSIIGYVAVEKFGPKDGDRWEKYIAWSGLQQLSRVITTDGCLCPSALDELSTEDWNHNIQQDFMIKYFRDLEYLQSRILGKENLQILGFLHQPTEVFPHGFTNPHFKFAGYDLVDKGSDISALLNCGGYPESFSNSELNEFGLLSTLERAKEVQENLLRNNPGEFHADCDIRALWIYRDH